MTLEESKVVLDNYIAEVKQWYKENSLTPTPTYNELLKKEVWGASYRNDINYFREVSDIKANFVALKTYFTQLKSGMPVSHQVKVAPVLDYINDQIKLTDVKIFQTKEQLEYYKTVVYVIGNFSYGDYA